MVDKKLMETDGFLLTTRRCSVTLVYVDSTIGWRSVQDSTTFQR